MMDPDFAGKLSADIGSEDADTDFSFGDAEPNADEKQEVEGLDLTMHGEEGYNFEA